MVALVIIAFHFIGLIIIYYFNAVPIPLETHSSANEIVKDAQNNTAAMVRALVSNN